MPIRQRFKLAQVRLVASLFLPAALACGGASTPNEFLQARDGGTTPSPSPSSTFRSAATDGGSPSLGPSSPSSPSNDDPSCEPATPAAGVTLGAPYAGSYKVFQFPLVPGLPSSEELLAITLEMGDPNALLFGCYPTTTSAGSICSVGLTRSCQHITGFAGNATSVGSAPNIDGSLMYAPGGALLFTGWPENTLAEIPAGGTAPTRTIDLASLGIMSSVGSIQIVPPGFAGAGTVKIVSYDTGWLYQADLVASGGLFQLSNVQPVVQLGGGPEGFAYIPKGSPQFPNDSIILSEWNNNAVVTYQIDGSGNPILSTRTVFVDNLMGAEGAYFDTVTGDFIFATWNGNCDVVDDMATNCVTTGQDYVYAVQGFAVPQVPQ